MNSTYHSLVFRLSLPNLIYLVFANADSGERSDRMNLTLAEGTGVTANQHCLGPVITEPCVDHPNVRDVLFTGQSGNVLFDSTGFLPLQQVAGHHSVRKLRFRIYLLTRARLLQRSSSLVGSLSLTAGRDSRQPPFSAQDEQFY